MHQQLSQQAIRAALNGHWQEAIKANLELLKLDGEEVETRLRLARAYLSVGEPKQAHRQLKICLKLDPLNNIAHNLLTKTQTTAPLPAAGAQLDPHDFIETPGQTFHCQLTHLTNTPTLFQLNPGDKLLLTIHPHSISLSTFDGAYLGRLNDLNCLKVKRAGCCRQGWEAVVKNTTHKTLEVIIKPKAKNDDKTRR